MELKLKHTELGDGQLLYLALELGNPGRFSHRLRKYLRDPQQRRSQLSGPEPFRKSSAARKVSKGLSLVRVYSHVQSFIYVQRRIKNLSCSRTFSPISLFIV